MRAVLRWSGRRSPHSRPRRGVIIDVFLLTHRRSTCAHYPRWRWRAVGSAFVGSWHRLSASGTSTPSTPPPRDLARLDEAAPQPTSVGKHAAHNLCGRSVPRGHRAESFDPSWLIGRQRARKDVRGLLPLPIFAFEVVVTEFQPPRRWTWISRAAICRRGGARLIRSSRVAAGLSPWRPPRPCGGRGSSEHVKVGAMNGPRSRS